MPLNDQFYKEIVKCFKRTFEDIFVDDVVLEEICCQFSSRGYFKIAYKYVPSNYSIIIENEMRLFNIEIEDEEGASTHLNRIRKHDGSLNPRNIKNVLLLLKKVLRKNNFPFYIYEEDKIYRKMDGKIEEIDISQM